MSKAAANELKDIKSLKHLMEDDPTDTTGALEVSIDLIDPDPEQPRRDFAEEDTAALGESIAVQGVIQPLIVIVHPTRPGRYMIVAGERRWRAARQVGLATVLVIVRELSAAQRLAVQVLENTDRVPLHILEEAAAVARLVEFGNTPKQAGEMLGKTKTWISLRRKIAAHIERIAPLVAKDRTTDPETLCLLIDLAEEAPALFEDLANQADASKLTRAAVRAVLDQARAKPAPASPPTDQIPDAPPTTGATATDPPEQPRPPVSDPKPSRPVPAAPPRKPLVESHVQQACEKAEQRIKETWSLKVKAIWSGDGEKGELRIEFLDMKDLENITNCLAS